MAYARPLLTEIIARKIADIDSRLVTPAARLRRSILNALLRASAAVEHGLYGFINYLSRQIVPGTADDEYLLLHANWHGLSKTRAVAATGQFTAAGNGTIPAGTLLQRSDGVTYSVDTEITVSGSASVAITGTTVGQNGNAQAGLTLTFITPLPGIQSTVIAGAMTGGADEETTEAFRHRFREYVQEPPHGGSKSDYIRWAKEVPGVTRAWCFPGWLGAGTVGVFFVRDNDASIIPDPAEVDTVQKHLDDMRPVTAILSAIAPIKAAQDLTIKISPNTAAVQAAVTAELADLFSRSSSVETGAGSGTIYISKIRESVSIAAGENNNVVTVPADDITLSVGEIATLGTITFESL